MTISGGSSSFQLPAVADVERGTLVLKKEQDVAKAEGQALVALIEKSSAASQGFSAYA
jgi:hypothetical protein